MQYFIILLSRNMNLLVIDIEFAALISIPNGEKNNLYFEKRLNVSHLHLLQVCMDFPSLYITAVERRGPNTQRQSEIICVSPMSTTLIYPHCSPLLMPNAAVSPFFTSWTWHVFIRSRLECGAKFVPSLTEFMTFLNNGGSNGKRR